MPGHLSPEHMREIEAMIGYKFKDKSYPQKAFEAAGATSAPEGHKRLAHIGDNALRISLSLPRFNMDCSTNCMTIAQNTIGTNENLARVGFSKGLEKYIKPGRSVREITKRMMATTVEAIIGGVYLDSGHNVAITMGVVDRLGLKEENI